jgi:hypothetical protein
VAVQQDQGSRRGDGAKLEGEGKREGCGLDEDGVVPMEKIGADSPYFDTRDSLQTRGRSRGRHGRHAAG